MDTLKGLFGGPIDAPTASPATPLPPTPVEPALDPAVALVQEFEGTILHPYQDPVGIWTIGTGSTRDLAGNPVTKDTPPITKEQDYQLVERDLKVAIEEIARDVKVSLTAVQKGALEDFIYNLGGGNFRASTLLKKLNAGDYHGAAAEFDNWNRAGGKVLAGLVRRRAAEHKLFES